MATPQYLPDLVLAGLSVDDLIDLHNYLLPLERQFETDNLGRPFTAKIPGRDDIFDDTQIGAVVSSISAWAIQQRRKVLAQLLLCAPTSADEQDYRAAILMADTVHLGDWKESAALFKRLHAEAIALDSAAKSAPRRR